MQEIIFEELFWVRPCHPSYVSFILYLSSARSERYHHLASDEDEETNDEESSLEIRQFASWSHRFSKVRMDLLKHENSEKVDSSLKNEDRKEGNLKHCVCGYVRTLTKAQKSSVDCCVILWQMCEKCFTWLIYATVTTAHLHLTVTMNMWTAQSILVQWCEWLSVFIFYCT